MKIRSYEELEDAINKEWYWRKKEIHNHYMLLSGSRSIYWPMLIRAGIALLYAHWEGFLKKIIKIYFRYIYYNGICIKDASSNVKAIMLIKKLKSSQLNKVSWSTLHCIVKTIDEGCYKLQDTIDEEISAHDNLNTEVLTELLEISGIDPEPFKIKDKFIDYSLVGMRNKICHGENEDISREQFFQIKDTMLEIINEIKDKILNQAAMKKFKKTI